MEHQNKKKFKRDDFFFINGWRGKFKLLALVIRCASKITDLKKDNMLKEINHYLFPSLEKNFKNETLDLLSIPKEKDYLARILGILSQKQIITTTYPYTFLNDLLADSYISQPDI